MKSNHPMGYWWNQTGNAKKYLGTKIEVKVKILPVLSDFLWPHGLYPTRLLHPWNFLGKSTGVGCHFLLQGIFLTWGSNPGLPHCRQTLYHLSHQEVSGDKNWSTTIQNLWNAAKAVQRGKCRVIQNYLKKQTKIANKLTVNLKALEKGNKTKKIITVKNNIEWK